MGTFARQIEEFTKKAEKELAADVRNRLLELFSNVVELTPVQSGRAKGNWICGTGPMATGETGIPDKTGKSTIARIKAVLDKIEPGKTDEIWLVNNTPYIDKLEYGSSEQAPNGMVRLSIQKMQGKL